MNLSVHSPLDRVDELYSRPLREGDPRSPSSRPRAKTLPVFLRIFLVLGLAACTAGAMPTDPPNPAPPKTSECTSYQQELRACLSAVGAPLAAADTFWTLQELTKKNT